LLALPLPGFRICAFLCIPVYHVEQRVLCQFLCC
jgi:hypothetical protein